MIKTFVSGIPEKLDELVNNFEKEKGRGVCFATQTEMIEFKGQLMFRATVFYKE
jgi:hypothetical protein